MLFYGCGVAVCTALVWLRGVELWLCVCMYDVMWWYGFRRVNTLFGMALSVWHAVGVASEYVAL